MGTKSHQRLHHPLESKISELVRVILAALFVCLFFLAPAQDSLKYWIQFTDKDNSPYSIFTSGGVSHPARSRQAYPAEHIDRLQGPARQPMVRGLHPQLGFYHSQSLPLDEWRVRFHQ